MSKSYRNPILVFSAVLLLLGSQMTVFGNTFMFSNGSTILDYPSDVLLQSGTESGSSAAIRLDTRDKGNIVLDAGDLHTVQIIAGRLDLGQTFLNSTQRIAVNELLSKSLIINGTFITTIEPGDITISPDGVVRIGGGGIDVLGPTYLRNTVIATGTLDLSTGSITLATDAISGDNVEGGTIDSTTIKTLTSQELTVDNVKIDGNIVTATTGNLELSSDSGNVKLAAGKMLDLSGGSISLGIDAISGNSVEGGIITATEITTLTSTTVKAGTITTDSGDLTLSAGGDVKLDSSKTMDLQAGTTTLGDTNLPSGKTLDVSAGALVLNNDQISGDKVEGGTIDSISIESLTSTQITGTVIDAGTVNVNDSLTAHALHDKHGWIYHDSALRLARDSGSFPQLQSFLHKPVVAAIVTDLWAAVSDNRYAYFGHATGFTIFRLDTYGDVTSASSVSDYYVSVPGCPTGGYRGTGSTGKHVFFFFEGCDHIVRYDINADFQSDSSWSTFNMSNLVGEEIGGTIGEMGFDGRYMYVSTINHFALRLDGEAEDWQSPSAWSVANLPTNQGGYHGATVLGDMVYFTPFKLNDIEAHGRIARVPLSNFSSVEHWHFFDLKAVVSSLSMFTSCVSDARYLYCNCRSSWLTGPVIRFDSTQTFDDPLSWKYFDIAWADPDAHGYVNMVTDGQRYIYVLPYYDGSDYHGRLAVYDTTQPFLAVSSWQIIDYEAMLGAGDHTRFRAGTFVNNCLYFCSRPVIGIPLRSGQYKPAMKHLADTSDFYLSNGGDVGVGTSQPISKLHVEGEVMAAGGYRDSHSFSSNVKTGARVPYLSGSSYSNSYPSGGVDIGPIKASDFSYFDLTPKYGEAATAGRGFQVAICAVRYCYFAPYEYLLGTILRYDTQAPFQSTDSWTSYVPYHDSAYLGGIAVGDTLFLDSKSGIVKYDMRKRFNSSASWELFDLEPYSGVNVGASIIQIGKYLYFPPAEYDAGVIRQYDTTMPFSSVDSYKLFDVTSIDANAKGYHGSTCDGLRYIYFAPFHNGAYHGNLLRFDASIGATEFNASTSAWEIFNLASIDPGLRGFRAIVSVHRYVYIVPYYTSNLVRYDTMMSFTDPGAYSVRDLGENSLATGYYQGNFVYMAPWSGNHFYRLDITRDFSAADSLMSISLVPIVGGGGFVGMSGDGRYLYICPFLWGVGNQLNKMLRYDTHSSKRRPNAMDQLATDPRFFMTNQGNIGVGTMTPSTKLEVAGSLKASIVESTLNTSAGWYSNLRQQADVMSGYGATGSFGQPGDIGAGLDNPRRWESHTLSSGNVGGLFDGRYIYVVSTTLHQYDTTKPFNDPSAWKSKQILVDFSPRGGCFDGTYIYFPPYSYGGTQTGVVVRYDTRLPFEDSSSFAVYNAMTHNADIIGGFQGCVYLNDMVYITPFKRAAVTKSGRIVRYNTTQAFDDPTAWSLMDVEPLGGKAFMSAVVAGDSIIYVPADQQLVYPVFAKYDTKKDFHDPNSWTFYEIDQQYAYIGGTVAGRYVLFSPFYSSAGAIGVVLRLDLEQPFNDSAAWDMFDASNAPGGPYKGFVSCYYDNRYVVWAGFVESGVEHGRMLVWDTRKKFNDLSSWSGLDLQQVVGPEAKGFYGIASDGRYIYLIPNYQSDIVRFDTRMRLHTPSIHDVGVGSDFYVAPNGNIGIGTTVPNEKLHVVGNAKVSMTLSANIITATSTCCSSDSRLKSNVTGLVDSLSAIKKMRAIRYNWKRTGEPSIGFVAQELEPVVPEVVVTDSDGYKAVDYGKLSAVLVSAMQEMEAKNERMEMEMEELKHQNQELIRRLEVVEALFS